MHEHALVTRRDALKIAGISTLGLAAAPSAALARPQSPAKRVLRLAHLTDIHVQPERRAADGMIACLQHVQSVRDKPELILIGGDCVFDSFEAPEARAAQQWNLWNSALKNENAIPVRACIGNHDIWGGNMAKSKTTGHEPNYGKKRAIEMLHLTAPYYFFDQAGWRFVVLDSVQPDGKESYLAFLDDPQFDWLASTLRDTPSTTPVLILSHVPIMSVTALLWAKQEQNQFRLSTSLMHADGVKLKDLFARHPNVKLCISGHLHLVDRCDYNGVTYMCNGAVSGNWWKGRHKDCDEGYAVIDLNDDGTFARDYVRYGWTAVPDPPATQPK